MDTPAIFQAEPLPDQAAEVSEEKLGSRARVRVPQLRRPVREPVPPADHSERAVRDQLPGHRRPFPTPRKTPTSAPEIPPDELPDDVLIYTLPSRYCLPDVLADEAWALFGGPARATPGCRRSATTSTTI